MLSLVIVIARSGSDEAIKFCIIFFGLLRFARNDEPTKSNRFACCYQQTKSQQIVGWPPHSFLLLESPTHADYPQAPIQRRFGFFHVGTATKSVRQYRPQMARPGRASATELHRTLQYRTLAALLYACAIPRRDAQSPGAPQSMGAACRLAGRRANKFATNGFAAKHQTKRSTPARIRRASGQAVGAHCIWTTPPPRVRDFGCRGGTSLTRWT